MKDIKQEGWDEINANADKDNKKLHDKQLDLDRLYKKTFRTPEGQKVLEHLESITIKQPCWIPGQNHSLGYSREGQNSIVREIKKRLERKDIQNNILITLEDKLMNKSKNINFIQMSNLSKKQSLAKIKKSLLALGLKYKPKDSTKK